MSIIMTIIANILYYGMLFLTGVMCCVGAGVVAFLIYPFIVEAFPATKTMYSGYPAIILSCFQFLFIPSLLMRLRNFCGISIKATLVDHHGFQSDQDKMNYNFKAEGLGGGMY